MWGVGGKFQNLLRNTTQVIIWHRVKFLFSVISSPITLERQKWKSSKMIGILLSSPVSCWWREEDPFIFDDFLFCRSRVIGLDMTGIRIFSLCRMITWVVFLRMFWNFVKNERDPPLFTGKLLTKFQNILRNTTQVIIRHRIKILFSVISSPREEDPFLFWRFSLLPFQSYWTWYDGK
jgi:hypothetical protein